MKYIVETTYRIDDETNTDIVVTTTLSTPFRLSEKHINTIKYCSRVLSTTVSCEFMEVDDLPRSFRLLETRVTEVNQNDGI